MQNWAHLSLKPMHRYSLESNICGLTCLHTSPVHIPRTMYVPLWDYGSQGNRGYRTIRWNNVPLGSTRYNWDDLCGLDQGDSVMKGEQTVQHHSIAVEAN